MNLSKRFLVKPGDKIKLADWDPADTAGLRKSEIQAELEKRLARMFELQYRLYAENKQALLIVLQAMDAGGKDGTIRHVMGGLNPQGCRVSSFKKPVGDEAQRHFLWRIHKAVPARGEIAIFNRSHYEDVLVVRVHDLVPEDVWSKRYDQINDFEQMLSENNVTIVKFFLHISKDEQKERFQERIDDTNKHWKISLGDFEERKHWDDYMKAFEAVLRKCSTKHAPWYIIPSDKKWFRNLAVAEVITETLESMNPDYPPPMVDVSKIVLE